MSKVIPALAGILVALFACGGGTTSSSAPPGADQGASGERIFAMHCVLCHGKDGTLGINDAKDLTVSTLSKEEMVAMVANGKGTMMPYKNVLTKGQIEAVVEHVRTLQATE